MVEIAAIAPNPHQPRQVFDDASIQSLAQSIKTSGLMQPVVVRPILSPQPNQPRYTLIAGERRWRAAQVAGLKAIPALIRDVDDRTAAELALVENLQREDLNPIDRAQAFQRLIEDFGLTHQEIAQQVGLDRSSISNHLRLLELDESIRSAIRNGQLSLGHAKALLSVTNLLSRKSLADSAIKEQWSVRETERRAREAATATQPVGTIKPSKPAASMSPGSANTADLARRLGEHLGTKVHLHTGRIKGSGRLVIEFYSLDQFEGLLRQLQFSAD